MTADKILKMCPACEQWNFIDWWWHSESLNRWVCYGCGMGRSKEYQQDQKGMEKYYATTSSTQAPSR
jgi:Zn ribbon nucleic-acid-binding protein